MTIWLISDWHLGHANTFEKFRIPCQACLASPGKQHGPYDEVPSVNCSECQGTAQQQMRPFHTIEQMHERMLDEHNSRVKVSDHVYMLGDVCIRKEHLAVVKSFNGHKRLVRGNHDIFKTKDYIEAGFKEIHGCRVIDNFMLTHVPIHPGCLARFRGNIHGHTHWNLMGPGYLNVGVERLEYAPITLEDAALMVTCQQMTQELRSVVNSDAVEEIELLGE